MNLAFGSILIGVLLILWIGIYIAVKAKNQAERNAEIYAEEVKAWKETYAELLKAEVKHD